MVGKEGKRGKIVVKEDRKVEEEGRSVVREKGRRN